MENINWYSIGHKTVLLQNLHDLKINNYRSTCFKTLRLTLLESDQCGQNLNQLIESLNKIYEDFKALVTLNLLNRTHL